MSDPVALPLAQSIGFEFPDVNGYGNRLRFRFEGGEWCRQMSLDRRVGAFNMTLADAHGHIAMLGISVTHPGQRSVSVYSITPTAMIENETESEIEVEQVDIESDGTVTIPACNARTTVPSKGTGPLVCFVTNKPAAPNSNPAVFGATRTAFLRLCMRGESALWTAPFPLSTGPGGVWLMCGSSAHLWVTSMSVPSSTMLGLRIRLPDPKHAPHVIDNTAKIPLCCRQSGTSTSFVVAPGERRGVIWPFPTSQLAVQMSVLDRLPTEEEWARSPSLQFGRVGEKFEVWASEPNLVGVVELESTSLVLRIFDSVPSLVGLGMLDLEQDALFAGRVSLARISIAMYSETMSEIARLTLGGFDIQLHFTSKERRISALVNRLQLDNQQIDASFPVVWAQGEPDEAAVKIRIEHRLGRSDVIVFDDFQLRLSPARLFVDDNAVATAFAFIQPATSNIPHSSLELAPAVLYMMGRPVELGKNTGRLIYIARLEVSACNIVTDIWFSEGQQVVEEALGSLAPLLRKVKVQKVRLNLEPLVREHLLSTFDELMGGVMVVYQQNVWDEVWHVVRRVVRGLLTSALTGRPKQGGLRRFHEPL